MSRYGVLSNYGSIGFYPDKNPDGTVIIFDRPEDAAARALLLHEQVSRQILAQGDNVTVHGPVSINIVENPDRLGGDKLDRAAATKVNAYLASHRPATTGRHIPKLAPKT